MTEVATRLQLAAMSWFAIGVVLSAALLAGPLRVSQPAAMLVAVGFACCVQAVRFLGTRYLSRRVDAVTSAKSYPHLRVVLDPRRRDAAAHRVDLQALWGPGIGVALAAPPQSEPARLALEAWLEHQRVHWRRGHATWATVAQFAGVFAVVWILLIWDTSRGGVQGLAARGATPAAFGERCIPAGCVAPPSNIGHILSRRALPAGRLARLGATPDLHHGLLAARVLLLLAALAAISLWETFVRRLCEADVKRSDAHCPAPDALINAGRDLPLNVPVCRWAAATIIDEGDGG